MNYFIFETDLSVPLRHKLLVVFVVVFRLMKVHLWLVWDVHGMNWLVDLWDWFKDIFEAETVVFIIIILVMLIIARP